MPSDPTLRSLFLSASEWIEWAIEEYGITGWALTEEARDAITRALALPNAPDTPLHVQWSRSLRHPVYPGGPDCNPNGCPGPGSVYHDGYADGYERAAITALRGDTDAV